MSANLKDYNLRELVSVDDRFQNSINIQLDLNKIEKILSYIPTKSSVEILKRYLNNVLDDTKEKSTLLIGPYGKGKSHLLLVLLSLLSMDYTEEYQCLVNEVVERINNVDEVVAESIMSIRNDKKRYLPIIITNTHMDLNHALLLALNDTLKRHGLENIQPNTYYAEAEKVIRNWEENYTTTYKALSKELKLYKRNISQLVIELNEYNKEALDVFAEIYPKLTAGSTFNPLINTDVLSLFKDINEVLCDEHGFNGMFIVFDEFSKYIEGHDVETIASDMKVLQDMCELSNASKNKQIHTLLIAHKSIKQYNNVLSKEVINSFTGVEGRIKEVLFVTSSQNNYELIQNAIIKKELYDNVYLNQQVDLDSAGYEIPAFKSLFTFEDFTHIVQKGCFPLLPVASYLLLNISEKVAQNERTLFTFISKDEPYSMARIIKERSKEDGIYISADNIYDYFKGMFKSEVSNSLSHSEWLKAEHALKNTKNQIEEKIIKTLAILNIVNKKEEVPATEKYLALSAGLLEAEVKEAIDRLLSSSLIEYRVSTGIYHFKNKVGVELDREIKRTLDKKSGRVNISSVLKRIIKLDYILPKIHNQEFCIKRFYESKFMLVSDFLELENSGLLFDEFADGKVIYILSYDRIDITACKNQLEKLNDKRLILVLPKGKFNKISLLERYEALETIKENKEFILNHQLALEEIELYIDEIRIELNTYIKQMYGWEKGKAIVMHNTLIQEAKLVGTIKELNRFISCLSDDLYSYTPIINNEMVNKHRISTQIKTARNTLVNRIVNRLDLKDLYYATSPEASIFRTTLLNSGVFTNDYTKNIGLELLIQEIKKFILSAEGVKVSFKVLYNNILNAPFGVRKGVVPIYVAFSFRCMEDTPIIYKGSKEIVLDSDVLSEINENPNEFYLYIEKGTKEKVDFLNGLNSLFDKYKRQSDYNANEMTQIVYAMQRWMHSLPATSSKFGFDTNKLSITESEFNILNILRKYLKKIECNPRELLLEIIPNTCKNETLFECLQNIKNIKVESDNYINNLKNSVLIVTKEIFSSNKKDNLATSLKLWYSSQSDSAKHVLLSTKISTFMNCITNIDTYDEYDIVNRLSKIVLDLYIENWNDNTIELYENEITKLRSEVESTFDVKEKLTSKNKIIIVSDGKEIEKFYDEATEDQNTYFFKNELESLIEEYGESLEISQKVSILAQLILDLIN